jgi:hypothetical protein
MPSKAWQTSFLTVLFSFWLMTASQSLLAAPINISREQYDAAFAKWSALHITDYEETVRFEQLGEWQEWKVAIHTDPSSAQAVDRISRFEGIGDNLPSRDLVFKQDDGYVNYITVGRLLTEIGALMQHPKNSQVDYDTSLIYVEFDPTMGYPRILELDVELGGTVRMQIENVKALKSVISP